MLVPVVTFYLLRDWDVMIAKVRGVLPRAWEPTAVALARECDEVVSAFIRGQLLVMLALGFCYTLGLMLVGLDLALLIGVLAGLASIVPYLGLVLGVAAAAVAALVQFGDWVPLVWVALVFVLSQMLEGMYLTPKLVGDRIGLHPVVVIFAVMAGGQLFGFTGVLLALPVSAVIMVLLRHVHERYRASRYYGPAAVPEVAGAARRRGGRAAAGRPGLMPTQLPLPVRLPDEASFANFLVCAQNRAAVDALRHFLAVGHGSLFLHGPPGQRTHPPAAGLLPRGRGARRRHRLPAARRAAGRATGGAARGSRGARTALPRRRGRGRGPARLGRGAVPSLQPLPGNGLSPAAGGGAAAAAGRTRARGPALAPAGRGDRRAGRARRTRARSPRWCCARTTAASRWSPGSRASSGSAVRAAWRR